MTSDESSEGFLQRWSRKKLDAEQREAEDAKPKAAAPERAEPTAGDGVLTPAAAAKPEFDLSSLPSLESITAGTDVRAFLNPGVPADLARAALRRAWTADATIRDFVGLAENAWDFNDPNAMPGFGPLEPGYDVKRAVAQMFGEAEKLTGDVIAREEPAGTQPARLIERSALPKASGYTEVAQAEFGPTLQTAPDEEPKTADRNFVQRDNITASHNSDSEIEEGEYKPRRNHGGALPQ